MEASGQILRTSSWALGLETQRLGHIGPNPCFLEILGKYNGSVAAIRPIAAFIILVIQHFCFRKLTSMIGWGSLAGHNYKRKYLQIVLLCYMLC